MIDESYQDTKNNRLDGSPARSYSRPPPKLEVIAMSQAWIPRTTSAVGSNAVLTARIAAPSEVRTSRLWVIGLSLGEDGTLSGPGPRWQDSYLADCECPDDCLRDHENE
jgi:hypothetical protein